MKRSVILALTLGLLVGSVATADAAKKKKPQKVTFFLHGTEILGEVDMANNFAVGYNKMDTTEPESPAPKSRAFVTWAGDPAMWNDCAGSFLVPNWTGALAGKVVGDMKVTLHTFSGPKSVIVQVWPDLTTQTCASNDLGEGQYPQPAGEVTVELPPGPGSVEAVLEGLNFKAVGSMMIQVTPVGPVPGRVLYDSPDFASSVEFSCIPTQGRSCTP